MVHEGIVMGYKITPKGIEVVEAKILIIEKLPPPTSVKTIRTLLRHPGFDRKFIQDFSKITKPLTKQLKKNVPFEYSMD